MTTSKNIFKFASLRENKKFARRDIPDGAGKNIDTTLSRMVSDGRLKRVERGVYALADNSKPQFCIIPDDYSVRLNKIVSAEFPYTDHCIWNPVVLTDFMVHVPNIKIHIIEIERVAINSLFDKIEGFDKTRRVLANPGMEEYGRYGSGYPCIIIKPLVSQAPLQTTDSVKVPSAEKILVDLLTESPELSFASGGELHNIWSAMTKKYDINEKALLRYAERRSRKIEATVLLNNFRDDKQ